MFEYLLLNYCAKSSTVKNYINKSNMLLINIIFRIWLKPDYRCACEHGQSIIIEI